jgi:hypothetical protein
MEIFMKRYCAKVWWTAVDILRQAKALGLNWTLAEAETWLKENEDSIVFMMEDVGSLHIVNLLNEEKVDPS